MIIHAEKDSLLKFIQAANDVVGSKTFMNILSNVLITVREKVLSIRSTDANIHLAASCKITAGEDGMVAVHCNRFLNLLRSLPSGPVTVSLRDNRLIIEPEKAHIHCEMNTMDPKEFPPFPEVDPDDFFSFPQKSFVQIIQRTSFAVSDDANRFFMNGVYLTQENSSLVMVGTDGRRLSYAAEPDDSVTELSGIIIPIKVLRLVQRLAGSEGELRIAVRKTHVLFEIDDFCISAQSISGQFPDYHRVIPQEQKYKALVDRELLRDALRRMAVFAEKIRQVTCDISSEGLKLHAEDPEMGEVEENIPCSYEGEPMRLAFNYQYLIDPVMVEKDPLIEISFSDSFKVITMKGSETDNAFHIVMPLKTA